MSFDVSGATLIRRIQATPIVSKPVPMPFPVVGQKRDARCTQCGRTYRNTLREFCPKCNSYTVEEIKQ